MVRIATAWQTMKYYLNNLNFFPSKPPSTDENELRRQRISTRIFIIIFSIAIVILLFYTSLIKVTETINIKEPPFTQYVRLNSNYSQTLTCPCSKISINYGKFLQIEYTLHQVCSSKFLSNDWIDFLHIPRKHIAYLDGFRAIGTMTFQALKTLCDLINQTINNSLTQYYSNQYISASVIPQKLFESETKLLVDGFRSTMANNFLLSLSMIRNTTQANALISTRGTNYKLK